MDDLLIASTCVVPLVIYLLWTKGQGPSKARYACVGLGLAFCYFALGHFVVTGELAQMLPPWVPQRRLLIHATGCLEILIAAGLFTERWRGLAAIAAACVLIAFFPANIYAAVHHVGVGEHQQGPQYLWVRTPLQLFLLASALWLCRLKVRPTRDRAAAQWERSASASWMRSRRLPSPGASFRPLGVPVPPVLVVVPPPIVTPKGSVTPSSRIDGVHLDADPHAVLGRGLASPVARLIGPST